MSTNFDYLTDLTVGYSDFYNISHFWRYLPCPLSLRTLVARKLQKIFHSCHLIQIVFNPNLKMMIFRINSAPAGMVQF
jgi:hypothetical protein